MRSRSPGRVSALIRRVLLFIFGLGLCAGIGVSALGARSATELDQKSKSAKKIESIINCFPVDKLSTDLLAPPIPAPGQPLKVDVDLHVDSISKIETSEDFLF